MHMFLKPTAQNQYKNPPQTPNPPNQNKKALAFQYGETFTLTWCPTTAILSPDEYKRILKQMQGYLEDRDTCQGIEKLVTYMRGQKK